MQSPTNDTVWHRGHTTESVIFDCVVLIISDSSPYLVSNQFTYNNGFFSSVAMSSMDAPDRDMLFTWSAVARCSSLGCSLFVSVIMFVSCFCAALCAQQHYYMCQSSHIKVLTHQQSYENGYTVVVDTRLSTIRDPRYICAANMRPSTMYTGWGYMYATADTMSMDPNHAHAFPYMI